MDLINSVNFSQSPDQLFSYGESLGHGELHIKMDEKTGLRAIVAIHSTKLGPALGGCRFIEYNTVGEAVYDAMRLARGMSYKAAISNLPLGGGKAVIVRPKNLKNRETLFESFGSFINDLGGRYITAVDSGTQVEDMDIIHKKTAYVATISRTDDTHGDPSYSTALGVFRGIEAAVKFRLGKESLKDVHVAIQGTGHVGHVLAKHLYQAGAKISVCDVSHESAQNCAKEFSAQIIDPVEIYNLECDVFAPCALGAIVNDQTAPALKCKIVAGSANNQLAEIKHGQILMDRGILYVPDYVINAGGLIEACGVYFNYRKEKIKEDVEQIYKTVMAICERAAKKNMHPALVADHMAAAKINKKVKT